MDSSTRTLTASLAAITLAAIVVTTLTSPSSSSTISPRLDSNGRKIKGSGRTKHKRSEKNEVDTETPQYVVGLVNVGNTCFVNSVLQALASLPSLRNYLEARKGLGHDEDSITLTLGETIEMLNMIQKRRSAKRLVRILKTLKAKASQVLTSQQQDAQELFQILSTQLSEEREKLDHFGAPSLLDGMAVSEILRPTSPTGSVSSSSILPSSDSFSRMRRSSVSSVISTSQLLLPPTVYNRRHSSGNSLGGEQNEMQSELASDDTDRESAGMRESAILDKREQEKYSRAKSPFMGLLASRVSCVDCGYTAAIRHSTFDSLSLTVPMQFACSLEDCLDAFIHLDTINDFNCRKCTLLSASQDLELKIKQGKQKLALQKEKRQDQDSVSTLATDESPENENSREKVADGGVMDKKPSKSKGITINLEEMQSLKDKVDECLANNIEMDLSPIELKAIKSKKTTKHSMIAKPPQALCLHLNRSMFTPSGQIGKNPCRVQFGAELDFTRFTTSGHLTTVPTSSMSRRGSLANGSSASVLNGMSRPLLSSGSKSWTGSSLGSQAGLGLKVTTTMASLSDRKADTGDDDLGDGPQIRYRLCAVLVHLGVHNSGHFVTYRRIPSSTSGKWWRISDEDVQIVEWDLVKNAEAYMLFYEKET
ncbi:ubiquitin carboxyl-terminal hydrolase 1 [Entomortierella parvispora]|uniref:Ubiquitin carboxyl-terminal hydrolase n=1 Tax=Entomortierella parvispora TaxID=205924 RepID=A0A9P3LUY2_9FUNG|nr:ubiquitin carboxyl-terminal hydrolase 1 [Entomortierella parvispora]